MSKIIYEFAYRGGRSKIVQARLKTFDLVDGGGEEKGGVLVVEGVQRCLLFLGYAIEKDVRNSVRHYKPKVLLLGSLKDHL